MTPLIFGLVKGGKIVWDEPGRFETCLAGLEGKGVSIAIKRRVRPRSTPQNRYYWGVIVKLISEYTGFTPEESHDALRAKFLTDITLDPLPKVKSTSILNTAEFNLYMSEIREWAAIELGISIPEPNEIE